MINIVRNSLRPGYGAEMLRKLSLRLREGGTGRRTEASDWCRRRQVDARAWARSIDERLWDEASAFAREQRDLAARKSQELGLPVGGAGFYELLYFLVRVHRPETIVETGVAFGFSSRAFLCALDDNASDDGKLYSSDFPYFRLGEPEKIIGCLVEPELRRRWVLLIGSDRKNLSRIAADAPTIDLLHYDSDKSYSGRQFALRTLGPRLANDALILFDDIQDNLHFRDWVEEERRDHIVFEFGGKWIGLTGGPGRLHRQAR
jgi:predicted O-methyltransferase YrrM